MKVIVNSVLDFINEIVRAPAVYQQAVRMLEDRTPLQLEAVSFSVNIVLTAVCTEQDGTEYLVECVHGCGVDHVGVEENATAEVQRVRGQLCDLLPAEICVRPGRLEA